MDAREVARTTAPDYRGLVHTLRAQRAALAPGDRVVLVDDWVETGSQFLAARGIIAECGAELVGCGVIVDDMTDRVRREMGRVHALVRSGELPGDG